MKIKNELPSADQIKALELSSELRLYSFETFLNFLNGHGLPELARLSNLSFTFFFNANKICKKEGIDPYMDSLQTVNTFRLFKEMVNDLQELNEPDAVIMRLSNTDLEVNVNGLIFFIMAMSKKEDASYIFECGQHMIMDVIKHVNVDEAKEIYDFLDELKGVFVSL